jgi:hypothetical protein
MLSDTNAYFAARKPGTLTGNDTMAASASRAPSCTACLNGMVACWLMTGCASYAPHTGRYFIRSIPAAFLS